MRLHTDPAIDLALSTAYMTHPYYRSAFDRLRIVADPNVPTMATSTHWVTHYNPATVAGWTASETAAVLVHELEHLLRRHSDRCGTRDPGRFNRASDAEINQRLDNLPDGAIYPETLGMPRGRTAEIYYGAIEPPPPKPSAGEGEGEGGADGAADGASTGDGPPSDGEGDAKCGSAAGGPSQPHEAGDALAPGRGAQPGAADEARHEAAQSILANPGMPGTGEGTELREWAERELGIDRAAWYGALASAVGHTMAPHGAPVRWQWPGRRDPRDMGGAMVPRWTGNRPSCAVVIDTSASITPFDLEMAAAAGHYIARVADVVFYSCTTIAIRLGSHLPSELRGGGGTDMRAGIELAIAEGAKAVVVITDCETPWPDVQTTVPVIVGLNPQATRMGYEPPEWMVALPVVAQGSEES